MKLWMTYEYKIFPYFFEILKTIFASREGGFLNDPLVCAGFGMVEWQVARIMNILGEVFVKLPNFKSVTLFPSIIFSFEIWG